MDRAYSILTVKAVEDEQRIVRGIATTPTPDRLGDVVEPLGVTFQKALPLLHHHDNSKPVGTVNFDKPTKDGVEFEARLARVEEPASLKDRVDTAWGEIKAGLIRGVSIGFRALEHEPLNAKEPYGPRRFLKTEVVELSLVTVPANADAQISLIRSIDSAALAASGRKPADRAKNPAGAAASTFTKLKVPKMDNQDIRTRYQNDLVTKSEQRDALLATANAEGRTLDTEEDEKFEALSVEIRSLSKHLERLAEVESAKAATARPVSGNGQQQKSWDAAKPFSVVRTQPELEPGIRFARYARVKLLARVDGHSVVEMAKSLYPDDERLMEMFQRAAVAAATSAHATWASPLINPQGFADFVEYLRPMTILGKFGTNGIPSLHRIPFRIPLITQSTAAAAWWVGEGKGKPVTKWDYTRTQLAPLKVANIAVATMELLRDSSPSADANIRDELAKAIATRLDIDFIDPAKAAVANVSPASITNGITPIASEGTDADAVRKDMAALFKQFSAANNPLTSGVLLMNSSLASTISMMMNPLGQPEFGGVTRTGGTLFGYPIIVSDYITTNIVVLANAQDIYLADEGGVDVAMSQEASIEMSDAPAGDAGTPTGATSLVSMFQENAVAFRAERSINWSRRRTQSVSILNDVDWGGTETP